MNRFERTRRNRHRRRALLMGFAVAGAVASGFGSAAYALTDPEVCPEPTPGLMTPARAVLDAEITEQVEARLRKTELDRFTAIDVKTVAGVVCLTGTVSNVSLHGEAERRARSVDGVQNVVNHLRIPVAQ